MANTATNGTDILLSVDVGATPTVIGSQRGVTFDETNDVIDVSSKEQREMRVQAGRYSTTISLEELYVPSDAAFGELLTAMRNGTFIDVTRREFGSDFEEASAIVTSLSQDFPDQDAGVVSIEIQIDGAWTTL